MQRKIDTEEKTLPKRSIANISIAKISITKETKKKTVPKRSITRGRRKRTKAQKFDGIIETVDEKIISPDSHQFYQIPRTAARG